jgi:8-oxo-dGTP diphosphatase
VIDHGETLLDGLTREVFEETGLVVSTWSDRCYTVTVDAPEMGWQMTVEAWETDQVNGEICIADPDGIVEEVRHSNAVDALELLTASPLWVRLPVSAWLGGDRAVNYQFALRGRDRATAQVERI